MHDQVKRQAPQASRDAPPIGPLRSGAHGVIPARSSSGSRDERLMPMNEARSRCVVITVYKDRTPTSN
jgi:hypothetical protein